MFETVTLWMNDIISMSASKRSLDHFYENHKYKCLDTREGLAPDQKVRKAGEWIV